MVTMLGRIYMEQLFGQGSDEEEEEGAGGWRRGRGRGVSGGALAALSALLGGGSVRMMREDTSVDMVMAGDGSEGEGEGESDTDVSYESSVASDNNDGDDEEEEEGQGDESKVDHPTFTHQYDHRNYALRRHAQHSAQSASPQSQSYAAYDNDEEDGGDMGYDDLDSESRYEPRRGPDI